MKHENQVAAIVASLNESIRSYENSHPFDQIRYSLAGWAEYAATNLFDTTVEAIDPKLSALLHRIKAQRGKLIDGDSLDLIDYSISALDLRAPEDKLIDDLFNYDPCSEGGE